MLEYDEPLYSEDEIADACVEAGINDSAFESLMIALQRGRMTDEEKGGSDD